MATPSASSPNVAALLSQLPGKYDILNSSSGSDGVYMCKKTRCCCFAGSFTLSLSKMANRQLEIDLSSAKPEEGAHCNSVLMLPTELSVALPTKPSLDVTLFPGQTMTVSIKPHQVTGSTSPGLRLNVVSATDPTNSNQCAFSLAKAKPNPSEDQPAENQPKKNTPAKSGGSGASFVMPSMLGFVLLLLCVRHV